MSTTTIHQRTPSIIDWGKEHITTRTLAYIAVIILAILVFPHNWFDGILILPTLSICAYMFIPKVKLFEKMKIKSIRKVIAFIPAFVIFECYQIGRIIKKSVDEVCKK